MKQFILSASAIVLLILGSCQGNNSDTPMITYPETKKSPQNDDYFGNSVADPFRWLENDQSAETKAWVQAQNTVTNNYLSQIPMREKFHKRLSALWNYEKISAPFKAGERYFFYKNDGLQNQSVLYTQASLEEEATVFFDPNQLSEDGTVALAGISFSKDGKYLAYMLQASGSDWRTIHVMEVATKQKLEDEVAWVKFSGMAWAGNGFYYSRYDEPKEGDELKGANKFQKVYYHEVGTEQSKDQLIYQDEANPDRGFSASTTEDERFLVLAGWESTSGNTLLVKDLQSNSDFVTLVDDFEHDHSIIGNEGSKLYIVTTLGAPKQRLVSADFAKPTTENWADVIPEQEDVLESVRMSGQRLFAVYMKDAYNQVKQFALDGTLDKEVPLPAIGSVGGFGGDKDDLEVFYTFSSFTFPTSVYRYNIAKGESELFRSPKVDFDPEAFETKQVFFESHDGTKVPMFIVHKKGLELNGQNPTYLYGYGGFNISLNPNFSVSRLLFVESGGVFAMPNIRGGGEYGEAWHKGGIKMDKKNVFLDFIEAAEYLHKEGYTSPKYTAIAGGSNGGLLVGATMTMRPDICQVALPAVGVLDMLRYQNFTIGRAWSSDYGTSEDSKEMFEYLYSYSPLHNVKEGVNYPATLVTTADHDDRVVPAHSFKFISELQSKQSGANPVMIRIEEKAGHGAGKPTSKYIDEISDVFAFTFYNMGVNPFEGK